MREDRDGHREGARGRRKHYPRRLLYTAVVALFVANTINVGADLAAIAAAINLLVPALPIAPLVLPIAVGIPGLQIWGSYRLIANVFKWLTLALFAYIGSAIFARPDWGQVLAGTFIPTIRFDHIFLLTLVAILGTTMSPTPSPPASTVTSQAAQHFASDQVDFDYPAGWQVRAGGINPSGNETIVFVGSRALPSECVSNGCGSATTGTTGRTHHPQAIDAATPDVAWASRARSGHCQHARQGRGGSCKRN